MKYMDHPNKKYHVLARGVMISSEYILVAHCIGMDNTFLPGGHVEFNEGLKDTLSREIGEELGLSCEVSGYLGAVEAEFEDLDTYHQEINHVFTVKIPDINHKRNPSSKEDHLEFYWIRIKDMEKHNLQPHPVRTLIKNYLENKVQESHFFSTFDDGSRV